LVSGTRYALHQSAEDGQRQIFRFAQSGEFLRGCRYRDHGIHGEKPWIIVIFKVDSAQAGRARFGYQNPDLRREMRAHILCQLETP